MERGLVFKGTDGEIILLTIQAGQIVEGVVSDYDGLYDKLAETSADVVEIDNYAENTGNVAFRSICSVEFGYDPQLGDNSAMIEIDQTPATLIPARVVLHQAARQDIDSIQRLMDNAKRPDEASA